MSNNNQSSQPGAPAASPGDELDPDVAQSQNCDDEESTAIPTLSEAIDIPDEGDRSERRDLATFTREIRVQDQESLNRERDALAEDDDIQTLQDRVDETSANEASDDGTVSDPKPSEGNAPQDIAQLEAIVFGEGSPEPQHLTNASEVNEGKEHIEPPDAPLPRVDLKKSENPFLPKHILDRLNHGRNLVEEIAQSSAALDASTAALRAERLTKPAYGEQHSVATTTTTTKEVHDKHQLVDDLVEEYLPLLAAELRRRLNRLLDK